MILECSHCGAPLDVGGSSPFTRCNYCGRTSRTRNLKTQQAVTPQGWAPPPQWLPPPQFTIHVVQPLHYRKTSSAVGCIIVASVLIPIILAIAGAGFAFFMAAQRPSPSPSHARDSTPAEPEAEAWDGTSTLRCDTGDKIKVRGVEMKAPLAEVIVADGQCVVEIEDSQLKGTTIVRADGSAKVIIRRGSIEAGGTVAKTSFGAKVEIEDTEIALGSPNADTVVGVEATMTSEVTLARTDVTVRAKDSSKALLVDANMRAKVRLVDGHYKGDFGVKASGVSEVRKEGGDIEARLDVASASKASGFKDVKAKGRSTKSGPSSKGPVPNKDPLSPSFGPANPKCNCAPSDLTCNMKCSAKK